MRDETKLLLLTKNIRYIYQSKLNEFHKNITKNGGFFNKMYEWYCENPIDVIFEYILLKHDKIICYNYFIPTEIEQNTIFVSGGSFVDPSSKGEFVFFFRESLDHLFNLKKFPIIGFSNKYSFPIAVNKFGGDMKEIVEFKQIEITGILEKCNIQTYVYENISYSSFINDLEIRPWVKWRLSKPGNKYEIAKINDTYIVYKVFQDQIDFITMINCENLEEYLNNLLIFCEENLKNYKVISLITSNNNLINDINKNFYFHYFEYERHLCVKSNKKGKSLENIINNIEMIVSDVY